MLHVWLPGIVASFLPMSDLAAVLLSFQGRERHILGQMKVPVLFEGQVSLIGIREFHSILHELDGDVRWVEATHMTNQDVLVAELSRVTAVHLNLGWRHGPTGVHREGVRWRWQRRGGAT